VIFPYLPLPTRSPVPSLGGATVRYRPIVSMRIFGSLGSRLYDGCLDSASNDTIFPLSLARKLGIDLDRAPQGTAHPVGGMTVPISYAVVTLRLTDGVETCQWQAIVGFVDLPLRWALLGHAGFLDFFDTELHGARRELVINPNRQFPGTSTGHRVPSPK
jgi:hypothetical protein